MSLIKWLWPRDHDSETYNHAALDRRDLSVPRVGDAAPNVAASAKALALHLGSPPQSVSLQGTGCSVYLREQLCCVSAGDTDEEGADLTHKKLALCLGVGVSLTSAQITLNSKLSTIRRCRGWGGTLKGVQWNLAGDGGWLHGFADAKAGMLGELVLGTQVQG